MKTFNGKPIALEVMPDLDIFDLQCLYYLKSGLPPRRQSWRFAGKMLSKGTSLSDNNIQKGSICQVS